MRKAISLALVALITGVGATAWAESPAQAQTAEEKANAVSGLKVEETSKGTYLRLRSTQTPSFSVFKLRQPLRLVVDVSNSVLSADKETRRVDNGVVSRVALLQSTEDGRSRVRLIVGFDESTHYDVKTDGRDVVIFVEGAPRRDGESAEKVERQLQEKEQRLEQTRDRLTKLQRDYRQATDRLSSSRDRLEQTQRELEQLQAELEATDADAEGRQQLESKLQAKSRELSSIKSKLEDRSRAVDRLRERIAKVEQERNAARKRLATLQAKLEAEQARTARQARQLDQLRQERQRVGEKLDHSKQKYQSAEQKLADTRRRLEQTRQELGELRSKRNSADGDRRQKLQAKLEDKEQALSQMESELQSRRQTVQQLKSERDTAKQQLSDLRGKLERQKTASRETARKLEALKEQRDEWRQRLDEQKEQLADTRKRARQASQRLSKLEQQVASKDQTIASLESRLKSARQQDSNDGGVDDLADRVDALRVELQKSRSRIDQLESLRNERKSQLESLRQDRQTAQSELKAVRQQLAEAEKSRQQAEGAEPTGQAGRAVPVGGDSNTIQDIRLENVDGESRIVVELERPGEYRRLPWKESRAVMLLNNVKLPEGLKQTVAANGHGGAVRFVSSFEESDGQVRMEAELNGDARETIRQEGNRLVWEFAPDAAQDQPAAAKRAAAQPKPPSEGTTTTSAPPNYPTTVISPSKVQHVPGMSRKQLTIDLRDADIQNVLRLFAKEGNVNIIAGDDVEGNVTLRLRDVPLDQALLIILQSLGLGFEIRGNVIRVAPQEMLRKEQEARQKAQQRAQKLRPLEVHLMPINYASADELLEQVKRLQSPRGTVSVDERTNTLIIKDLPENIRSIRQLVGALDTQVPQVLIEARIVETNDTFSQEFGIQWGGDFMMAQGNGNPTGLVFPNVVGLAGGATDNQTPLSGASQNPNFAVNLPAAAGTGTGGALGLTLGSINGAVNLNLRLSAAEESGRAKIISAPKILTLDNRQATISQGTSIPISVVSAAGVQTVFVDATLELTVKPHVTPDGNVQLEIEATKNEPDFQNTGARGDPTIIRKQAETELLIEDGETTVIGGIYTRNSGSSITGIPILHRIPILGLLFKKSQRSERRTELMIFITPRVVNRAEALGGMDANNVQAPPQQPGGGANEGGGQ